MREGRLERGEDGKFLGKVETGCQNMYRFHAFILETETTHDHIPVLLALPSPRQLEYV